MPAKVIVTFGPAYEPVDEVRRITNFSTGELGSTLSAASFGWAIHHHVPDLKQASDHTSATVAWFASSKTQPAGGAPKVCGIFP